MSVVHRLRRHWALAAVCAAYLLAGALTLDAYGVALDMDEQREIGREALNYLAGDGEGAFDRLSRPWNRYYGAIFEAPLILVERFLALEDRRDIAVNRHLLTHLFFLFGGVACYLLVLRLFGSRPLALVAMVLFLLHPRIYAHSFFNTKDVPFLSMFMVALYLTHRAFRRDTLAAFLLCGAGVGLLANLRVIGIALFAAVLALRALDVLTAGGATERRRALLTGAGFTLAAALTYYASLPALWTDPIGRFVEMFGVLGSHPNRGVELFRGEWRYTPNGPPLDYAPVWVAITTPPVTLLLAVLGAIALARGALRRPRDMLRNGPLRFGLLLAALPVAAVSAIVVLESNVYTGWRQLYFLYAPLLLLTAFGLWRLVSFRHGQWPRVGAYALAGGGVIVTVVSLARIHPNEQSYFTLLTDRTTPERLQSRYGPFTQSHLYVAHILGDYPSGALSARFQADWRMRELPADTRERFIDTLDFRSGEPQFYELHETQTCPASALYVSRIYAVTLQCIVDPVAYFGELRRRALATEPLDRSRFNAHRVGDMMVYVRDGCSREDRRTRFFLYVHPVDHANLVTDVPPDAKRTGWGLRLTNWGFHAGYEFERLDFRFNLYGARIDGDCVAAVPLPAWPIARIETGQYTPHWAEAARRAVANAEPLASSAFDLWLDGRVLTYVRDGCSAEDTGPRFFLHVYPADAGDLPPGRAGHGFDNLDFSFHLRGAFTEDGACVGVARLPAYPIVSVHTGQFDEAGRRWEAEFAPPR